MFHIYQMPVPRLTDSGASFAPMVSLTARLISTTPEYAELWQGVMGTPWSQSCGAADRAERARLRAELDAIVAHLYCLTEDEFGHILSTFPLVAQGTKDTVLAEFRKLEARQTDDPSIVALIAKGESASLEFKATARWDLKQQRRSTEIEQVLVKTVAGFLNADGGTLLIGVADDGSIAGLGHDYATLKKRGRDGLGLFLGDLFLGHLGKDVGPCLAWTFHTVSSKDICRVEVKAAPRPVYVPEAPDEALYLRTTNSTRRLTTKEAVAYCRTRWPATPP
jgi:hypothetical protein